LYQLVSKDSLMDVSRNGVVMNRPPAFSFGVNATPRSAVAVAELARELEASGFRSLLTPDGPSHGAAVFPLLTYAAAATTTLHVGTYVIANDLHHPFHLAHNAATMQTLSDGRFELGLGAGRPGMDAEYNALGLQLDAPSRRLARLETSATIIRKLLHGEVVNEKGDDYVLTDAVLPSWLTDTPAPPVLIAGTGPRLLDMAARTADIVAVGAQPADSWDDLRPRFDRIDALSRNRDVRPEINMTINGVGNQLAGWFARLPQDQRERLMASDSPAFLWGSTEEIVEGLHKRYEQFGVTYYILAEELVPAMIPVINRLATRYTLA
jgi:probable F420-dependent oxidoreductase